jgi:hypothetical protein
MVGATGIAMGGSGGGLESRGIIGGGAGVDRGPEAIWEMGATRGGAGWLAGGGAGGGAGVAGAEV